MEYYQFMGGVGGGSGGGGGGGAPTQYMTHTSLYGRQAPVEDEESEEVEYYSSSDQDNQEGYQYDISVEGYMPPLHRPEDSAPSRMAPPPHHHHQQYSHSAGYNEDEGSGYSSGQEYENRDGYRDGYRYDVSVEGYVPPSYTQDSTPRMEPPQQHLYATHDSARPTYETTHSPTSYDGASAAGGGAPPPQSSFEAWLQKELSPSAAGAPPAVATDSSATTGGGAAASGGMYPYYGYAASATAATPGPSSPPTPAATAMSAYPSALPSSHPSTSTTDKNNSPTTTPTSQTTTSSSSSAPKKSSASTSDGIIVSDGGDLLKRRINFAQYVVTPAKLKSIYSRWLNGLWFAPTDLVKKASLNPLTMAYIPYWKFDVVATTEYVGEVLHVKKGNKEWTRAEGSVSSDYNDNYANACSVDEERNLVMGFKRKWNWKKVHYPLTEEEEVAAKHAEENASFVGKLWKSVVSTVTWSAPEVDAPPEHLLIPPLEWPTIWEEFQKMMAPEQQKKAENKLLTEQGGRRVRNVKVNVKINIKRKLIYMPLAVTSFTLDKAAYKVVINGQTGEVKGQRPYGAGRLGKLFGAGAK